MTLEEARAIAEAAGETAAGQHAPITRDQGVAIIVRWFASRGWQREDDGSWTDERPCSWRFEGDHLVELDPTLGMVLDRQPIAHFAEALVGMAARAIAQAH